MGPKKYKEPWPRFTGSLPLMLALGALSFFIYAKIWNWAYALLIVVSLFVHEMGHVWALWHYRLKVKGMYAIPLLGAAVVSRERVPDRVATIVFALMGPAWGYAFAALTYLAYLVTGWPILAGMSVWMAILNLFNLYPVSMLDGGQVWKVLISPFPRPLRILFLAAPVALMGYSAVLAGSLLVWLLFSVVLLATALENSVAYFRKRDRVHVTRALAKLLRVEDATPHAVSERIDLLIVQLRICASQGVPHPLFSDPAVKELVRRHIKPEDIPKTGQKKAFRLCLTKTAQEARGVIRVRGKTLNVTSDGDLDADGKGPLAASCLGFYLKGDPLQLPLPWVKAVTGFAVYCMLTFAVLSLVLLARSSPGAFDALLDLMQG